MEDLIVEYGQLVSEQPSAWSNGLWTLGTFLIFISIIGVLMVLSEEESGEVKGYFIALGVLVPLFIGSFGGLLNHTDMNVVGEHAFHTPEDILLDDWFNEEGLSVNMYGELDGPIKGDKVRIMGDVRTVYKYVEGCEERVYIEDSEERIWVCGNKEIKEEK